jgi:hypothetical protein
MNDIDTLMAALDEHQIAREVALPHDEARLAYRLKQNTVRSFDEFSKVVGDYYNHHFAHCITRGGTLPAWDACSRAKEILEYEYQRRNGLDILAAFKDALHGTNGGLRVQLDVIAEQLKAEAVERYIRDVFDRHIDPDSFAARVEILRQFAARSGIELKSWFDAQHPERYASKYKEVIRSYVKGLQHTAGTLRRL